MTQFARPCNSRSSTAAHRFRTMSTRREIAAGFRSCIRCTVARESPAGCAGRRSGRSWWGSGGRITARGASALERAAAYIARVGGLRAREMYGVQLRHVATRRRAQSYNDRARKCDVRTALFIDGGAFPTFEAVARNRSSHPAQKQPARRRRGFKAIARLQSEGIGALKDLNRLGRLDFMAAVFIKARDCNSRPHKAAHAAERRPPLALIAIVGKLERDHAGRSGHLASFRIAENQRSVNGATGFLVNNVPGKVSRVGKLRVLVPILRLIVTDSSVQPALIARHSHLRPLEGDRERLQFHGEPLFGRRPERVVRRNEI